MLIILILEIFMLISYLFSDVLGFFTAVILYTYIWSRKRYNLFNKIVISLILSAPIFQIGFWGKEMHHIFSWFMIFLAILIIYLFYNLVKNNIKFSKYLLFFITLTLGILFITNIISDYYIENMIEYFQVFLMVISIFMIYQQRKFLSNYMDDKTKDNWIIMINISMVATAIGVFVQYIAHLRLGLSLGRITEFPGRTTYDFLFSGYSVLSIYLGIGVVLNFYELFQKIKLKNIVIILLCLVAIAINSSRTGLIASLIVCILITLIKAKKSLKNFVLAIFISIIGIIIFYFAVEIILGNRQTLNILDDNGRIETYVHGIRTIFSSVKNFIFGIGLSAPDYKYMLPHNSIIQTMLTMGVIVTSVWIICIINILKYIKKIDFKYVIWYILISSMFVTSFQDMSFITLDIILAIILASINTNNK